MRESVAQMFESYVRACWGVSTAALGDMEPSLLKETRRAFYAGANAMFCQPGLSRPEMVRYEEELEAFKKEVLAGTK